MKTIIICSLMLANVALAGLPNSDLFRGRPTPCCDVPAQIVRCHETPWNDSLEISITTGGLAGLTMARVGELVDGAHLHHKTIIVKTHGVKEDNPAIRFFQGEGLLLEIDTTDGEETRLIPGQIEVELNGQLRRGNVLCQF